MRATTSSHRHDVSRRSGTGVLPTMACPTRAWAPSVVALVLALTCCERVRAQTCTVTMGGVDFGSVDVTSGNPTDFSSSIGISCTGYATPNVRVCVNLGAPNGVWDPRYMTGPGANRLNYNLYKDATYSARWSSVYEAPDRVMVVDLPLSGGAASTNVPYYGRVFAGQTGAPAGAYSNVFGTGDTLVQAGGYTVSPPTCAVGAPPETQRFVFTLLATVIANCTISSANIDFGQLGIIKAAVNTTGLVTTTCTKGANYAVSLSAGSGTGATTVQRMMTRSGGSETLAYALYSDAGRTQIWGDGAGGAGTVSGTGTGSAQTNTIYATVPVQTTPRPGAYIDTVIVTVTF